MDFSSRFQSRDILYGLQGTKDDYYQLLSDKTLKRASSASYHLPFSRAIVDWVKIDLRTNRLGLSLDLQDPEDRFQKGFYEFFLRSKYYDSTVQAIDLAKVKKNGCRTIDLKKMVQRDGWVESDLNDSINTAIQLNIIRRVCKYTLWYVLHNTNSQVHFVLDGMDIADVKNKR